MHTRNVIYNENARINVTISHKRSEYRRVEGNRRRARRSVDPDFICGTRGHVIAGKQSSAELFP